jgi:antitoxin CptB
MDERRKKLRFRAWRRGFREIDLILGRFADARISSLDAAELDAFEALLDAPDQLVYDWIAGLAPAPVDFDTPTLRRIRTFAGSNAPCPLAREGREGGSSGKSASAFTAPASVHAQEAPPPPPPTPSPQGGGGRPVDPQPEQFRPSGPK